MPKTILALAVFQIVALAGLGRAAERRTVVGTVFYRGGETASEAAVQIEDEVTLQVVSCRADRDGRYRYAGLNPDRDYQIRATKRGYWSRTREISRFSSRRVEKIDLYLRPVRRK